MAITAIMAIIANLFITATIAITTNLEKLINVAAINYSHCIVAIITKIIDIYHRYGNIIPTITATTDLIVNIVIMVITISK